VSVAKSYGKVTVKRRWLRITLNLIRKIVDLNWLIKDAGVSLFAQGNNVGEFKVLNMGDDPNVAWFIFTTDIFNSIRYFTS
jgi:hypothetical protein